MAERITLVLEAEADPNVRAGGRERDTVYRLKLALKTLKRAYGFRCVGFSGDPPAGGEEGVSGGGDE